MGGTPCADRLGSVQGDDPLITHTYHLSEPLYISSLQLTITGELGSGTAQPLEWRQRLVRETDSGLIDKTISYVSNEEIPN